MSAVVEASLLLQGLAEPRRAADRMPSMVRRVASLVGLAEPRVEGLWRQKARHVLAEEMDAIRAAHRARRMEEEARAELRTSNVLQARIAALEEAVRVLSEDRNRQDVAALVEQGRAHDRTMDR